MIHYCGVVLVLAFMSIVPNRVTYNNTLSLFLANHQIHTKMLSPFDDSVDKNPVVRSVVLKLLLKYRYALMSCICKYVCLLGVISLNCVLFYFLSFDDVKEYLQLHLLEVEQSNLLEESDKTELYCLYINCLEVDMI